MARAPRAGDTSIELSTIPAGWNVGDLIVVADTQTAVRREEVGTILDIVNDATTGNVLLVIDQLIYDHVPPRADLAVHVANTTRNAVIESENLALTHRRHSMFMHTRDVDVRYGGFYGLGRTNKIERIDDSVIDENGQLVAGTGTNQRARYSVHFHHNGTINDGNPSLVHGSAVVGDPGWAFVNHGSFVDFTSNVAYDVGGAAFVTESSDEIGRFIDNIAIFSRGSGESEPIFRENIQDFGHQGDGFWFQGPGVTVEGNVASGQGKHGIIFYTKGFEDPVNGEVRFRTSNLSDPSIANGEDFIDVRDVPIENFRNNIAYGNDTGGHLRYQLWKAEHEARAKASDLLFWNNQVGFTIPYTHQTDLVNITIINDFASPEHRGMNQNRWASDILYKNLHVEGYRYGLLLPERGNNVVDGGYFKNLINIQIGKVDDGSRSILITGPIVFDLFPPEIYTSRDRYDVQMLSGDLSPSRAFLNDSVTLNFGPFVNRRLYFEAQAADYIPFASARSGLPDEYVGKTNAELWSEFGIAMGGSVAPLDAIQANGIDGLLGPATP